MDVLCTDKTGTLTQDKIILEHHVDTHGQKNQSVLALARSTATIKAASKT